MNGLEVPAALARLAVDGDQALGEQVVAAAVAAVPVVGRRAGRQVGEAELLVGTHQAPDVRAAGDAPGLVLPGVGSDLPLLRHGVEGPELLAGPHVEAADVAGRSIVGTERTVGDGRSDDRHVAADGRRRTDGVLAALDRPVQTGSEVDAAVVAEGAHGRSLVRVDGTEDRVRAGVEQAAGRLGTLRIAPETRALVGEAVVRGPTVAVALRVVLPDRRAVGRVDGGGDAEAGDQVEPVADLDRGGHVGPLLHRRVFEARVVRHQVVVRQSPAPGRFEVGEVRGVDLVERGVAARVVAAGDRRPVRIAVLGDQDRGESESSGHERGGRCCRGPEGHRPQSKAGMISSATSW